jgi:Ser/Thr protein kinase RdoA (MazF antagonist)
MTSDAFDVKADEGRRWFVKVSRDLPCYQPNPRDRELALLSTLELQDSVNEVRVVAPVLTLSGSVAADADGRAVTVFPYIEGATLGRRSSWSDHDFASIARAVAQLHASTSRVAAKPAEDRLDIWWGESFEAVWLRFQASGRDTEVHKAMFETVSRHAHGIRQAVDECLRLRDLLMPLKGDWVFCHSDLNGGNILKDNEGTLSIIDWDEMCVAPMEKDFRHLVDMSRFGLALSSYLAVRCDEPPDPERLAFFLYRGYLADIAYWLCDLVSRPPGWVDPAFNLEEFIEEVVWVAGPDLPERISVLRRLLSEV